MSVDTSHPMTEYNKQEEAMNKYLKFQTDVIEMDTRIKEKIHLANNYVKNLPTHAHLTDLPRRKQPNPMNSKQKIGTFKVTTFYSSGRKC